MRNTQMGKKPVNPEEDEDGEIEMTEQDDLEEDHFKNKEINDKNLNKTVEELTNKDGTLNKRKTRTLSEKQRETLRRGREKRIERIREIQQDRQEKIAEMVEKVAVKKMENKRFQREAKRKYDEDNRIMNKLKRIIKEDEVDEEPIYDAEQEEKPLRKVKTSENLEEEEKPKRKPKKRIIIEDSEEDSEPDEIIIRQKKEPIRREIIHPRMRRDPLLRHRY